MLTSAGYEEKITWWAFLNPTDLCLYNWYKTVYYATEFHSSWAWDPLLVPNFMRTKE